MTCRNRGHNTAFGCTPDMRPRTVKNTACLKVQKTKCASCGGIPLRQHPTSARHQRTWVLAFPALELNVPSKYSEHGPKRRRTVPCWRKTWRDPECGETLAWSELRYPSLQPFERREHVRNFTLAPNCCSLRNRNQRRVHKAYVYRVCAVKLD